MMKTTSSAYDRRLRGRLRRMNTYRTIGETIEGFSVVLYEGKDPAKAVAVGMLAESKYILTYVTENGMRIKETEAF